MESIISFAGSPMYWVQPKAMQRWFELHTADGKVAASLGFESAFGSRAKGESSAGSWTFKRVGFLNARVTVRGIGSELDIAVYYPKLFGGGLLQTPGGSLYHWKQLNFWGTVWSFTDSSGTPLVTFRPGTPEHKSGDLLKTQSTVEVHSSAADPVQQSMLVLLGWYLIVMSNEDAAGAGAVTASM